MWLLSQDDGWVVRGWHGMYNVIRGIVMGISNSSSVARHLITWIRRPQTPIWCQIPGCTPLIPYSTHLREILDLERVIALGGFSIYDARDWGCFGDRPLFNRLDSFWTISNVQLGWILFDHLHIWCDKLRLYIYHLTIRCLPLRNVVTSLFILVTRKYHLSRTHPGIYTPQFQDDSFSCDNQYKGIVWSMSIALCIVNKWT